MAENIPIHDASHSEPVHRGWSLERFLRVSWGAIFAGFVVAFATLTLLLLLGGAVGLTMFDVNDPGSAEGWGWGAGIWYIVSVIIALFVGGLVAGRLAGVPRSIDSMLHGVATWGLIIVASLLLTGTAMGQLFGAATGMAQTREGEQQMQQIEQTAQQTDQQDVQEMLQSPETQRTADRAAGVAWAAFIAMLLGALAAMSGGYLGTPEDVSSLTETHHYRRLHRHFGGERTDTTPPTAT